MSTKITSNRKLQQEVDSLLKKVTEQMASFDDLFQKALEAEGKNREKCVAEVKKELNKLQRSNHELKSLAGNSDIRDDSILVEHTKHIQTAMGEYWELEKGAKTKKFSDKALSEKTKNSAEDIARMEQEKWLVEALDQLQQHRESAEFTLERDRSAAAAAANTTAKGGKRKGAAKTAANVVSSEELDSRENCLVARSKYHTFKIESLLRLMRNGELESYSITATKDEISEVLDQLKNEDCSEPDWRDLDDQIYDAFDLPEAKGHDKDDEDEEDDAIGAATAGGEIAAEPAAPVTPPTSSSPTKKGKKTKKQPDPEPTATHVDPESSEPAEPAAPVWTGKAAIPQAKETPVSEISKVIARAQNNGTTTNRSGGNSPAPAQNNFTAAASNTSSSSNHGSQQQDILPSLGGNTGAAVGGVWGRPVQQQTSASIAAQKVAEAPSLDSLAAPAETDASVKTKPKKTTKAAPPPPEPEPAQPEPVVTKKASAGKAASKKQPQQQQQQPQSTAVNNENVSLGAPAPAPASTSPWGAKKGNSVDKNLTDASGLDNNIVFDTSALSGDDAPAPTESTHQQRRSGPSLMMEDSPNATHRQEPVTATGSNVTSTSNVASLWGSDPAAATHHQHQEPEQQPISLIPSAAAAEPANTESDQQFSSILNLLKGMGQDDQDHQPTASTVDTSSTASGGGGGGGFGGLLGGLNHQADPFTSFGGPGAREPTPPPQPGINVLANDFIPASQQQHHKSTRDRPSHHHHNSAPPGNPNGHSLAGGPPPHSAFGGDEPEWNPRNGMNASAVPFVISANAAGGGSHGPGAPGSGHGGSWNSPPSGRAGGHGGGYGGSGGHHGPGSHHSQLPPPPQHSITIGGQPPAPPSTNQGVSPPAVPATPPSYNESQTPPMYSQRPGFPGGSGTAPPPPLPSNAMPPSVISPEDKSRQQQTPWGAPSANSNSSGSQAKPSGYMPPPESQRNKLYASQQPAPGVTVGQRGPPPAQPGFVGTPPVVAPRSQQLPPGQPGYAQQPPAAPLIPRVGGVNPPGPFGSPNNSTSSAPIAASQPSATSRSNDGNSPSQDDATLPSQRPSLVGVLNQVAAPVAASVTTATSGGSSTPATTSVPGTPMKAQISGSPTGHQERAMPAPAVTHVFWDFATVKPKMAGEKRETTKFWKNVTEVLKQPGGPGTAAKYFIKANLTKPQVFFRESDPKESGVLDTLKLLRMDHTVAENPRKSTIEAVKQLLVDQGLLSFSEEDGAPAIGLRVPGANAAAIKIAFITADPTAAEALSLCERAGVNFCVLHGFESDSEDAELLDYWVEKAPKVSIRSHDLLKDAVEIVPLPAPEKKSTAPMTAAAKVKMNAAAHHAQHSQSASTTKKGPIGGVAAPAKGKRGY